MPEHPSGQSAEPRPRRRIAATSDHPALTRRPLGRLMYGIGRRMSSLVTRGLFGLRAEHTDRVPLTGPVLILANHQSFLDPPIIGSPVTRRHLTFLARAGLFSFGPFGWIISNVNAIPVREAGNDKAAMDAIISALKLGQAVVMFPEGSRTADGAMHEFKRGVLLLVRRAKCPVLPVAIEGSFDAWPRGGLPRPFSCPLRVRYGELITYEEIEAMGKDALLGRLERDIDAMRLELRAQIRQQTKGRWPKPGPGDAPMHAEPEPASTLVPDAEPQDAR